MHWFYDPMAATIFEGNSKETAIVYDCTDEPSRFKGAPKELLERERYLLQMADVVFVGGLKLFRHKRLQNDNCHCYGCGVEFDYFAKARSPMTSIPTELASTRGPILGFFGVIDERMDYALLHRLFASGRPPCDDKTSAHPQPLKACRGAILSRKNALG